jgi:hypothetical protein
MALIVNFLNFLVAIGDFEFRAFAFSVLSLALSVCFWKLNKSSGVNIILFYMLDN